MSTFEFGADEVDVIDEDTGDEGGHERVVRSVTAQESINGSGYSQLRSTLPSAIVDELEIEKGDTLMMESRPDGTIIVDPK